VKKTYLSKSGLEDVGTRKMSDSISEYRIM